MMLFLASKGGRRSYRFKRKMASVAFPAFQRQGEKSANVGMMK
jgi:hypothetical protein